MSVSLFSALATIAAHGELAIGELAEAECLPSSAATRAADRLEEEGLVERRRNPSDRRGVNVTITPKGRAVVNEQRRKANAWLAERLAERGEAERVAIAQALDVLEALIGSEENEGTPVARASDVP